MFLAVSMNVSPLDRLDVDEAKSIVSAPRRRAASEKLVRYEEAWQPWAYGALAMILLEILLRTTIFRSVS